MDAFQKPISSPLPSKQNNVIFRKALISNRRDQLVSFRYEPCEKLIPADVKEFTLQHILRPASNIIKKKKKQFLNCVRGHFQRTSCQRWRKAVILHKGSFNVTNKSWTNHYVDKDWRAFNHNKSWGSSCRLHLNNVPFLVTNETVFWDILSRLTL